MERHVQDICLKLPLVSPQKRQRTGINDLFGVVCNDLRQASAARAVLLDSNTFLLVQYVQ